MRCQRVSGISVVSGVLFHGFINAISKICEAGQRLCCDLRHVVAAAECDNYFATTGRPFFQTIVTFDKYQVLPISLLP
jgi:hypothetical protein